MRTIVRSAAAAVATVALVAAALLVPAFPAAAATLNVPSQYGSIQAAVNAARNGDVVSVAAGTYTENVTVTGKYITVQGAGAGSTIIQAPGGSRRSTVWIEHVPYSAARMVLKGFTIQGGNAPANGTGGGLTVLNAEPEIADNTFRNNRTDGYGGAVLLVVGSDALLRGNTFDTNYAYNGGGALTAVQGSSPTLAENVFRNNWSDGWVTPNGLGGSSGGAVYLEVSSGAIYPVLINNVFENNRASFAGGAVMLRAGANAVIEGNQFTGNRAPYGGGVHAETTGGSVRIAGNTFGANDADRTLDPGQNDGGYGGAVAVFDRTSATIVENTFTSNLASRGGGGIVIAEGSTATIESNDFDGNKADQATSWGNSHGGAIDVADASVLAYNNVLARNSADLGGAIGVHGPGAINAVHNTFVSNEAPYERGGGAIFLVPGALSGKFSNNILIDNSNHNIYEPINVHVVKRNNLIVPRSGGTAYWGGTTGGCGGPGGGCATATDLNNVGGTYAAAGNFAGSPAFVNANTGDYALKAGSAAINAATTSDVPIIPSDDIRNVIRASGAPDVGAYEYEPTPIKKDPIFRFWSSSKRSHFYTSSASERDAVASDFNPNEWRYEGAAYDAFTTAQAGAVPLYRFYSQTFQGHFYTANQAERDAVDADYPDEVWKYEGVAYYVYPLNYTGPSNTVYRFWSPDNKHHFYTASQAESDFVRSNYPSNVWTYEGGNFRVPR